MRWRGLSVGDEKETTRELGTDGEGFIYSTPNARLRNPSDQLYSTHQRSFISQTKHSALGYATSHSVSRGVIPLRC